MKLSGIKKPPIRPRKELRIFELNIIVVGLSSVYVIKVCLRTNFKMITLHNTIYPFKDFTVIFGLRLKASFTWSLPPPQSMV